MLARPNRILSASLYLRPLSRVCVFTRDAPEFFRNAELTGAWPVAPSNTAHTTGSRPLRWNSQPLKSSAVPGYVLTSFGGCHSQWFFRCTRARARREAAGVAGFLRTHFQCLPTFRYCQAELTAIYAPSVTSSPRRAGVFASREKSPRFAFSSKLPISSRLM